MTLEEEMNYQKEYFFNKGINLGVEKGMKQGIEQGIDGPVSRFSTK